MNTKFIDITGNKINNITVIEIDKSRDKKNGIYWNCLCSCGKKISIRGDILRQKRIKSCGCLHSPDLVGKKFNMLKVVSLTKKRVVGHHNGEKIWKCICDCGKYTEVSTSSLTKNHVKSCGCLKNRARGKNPNWKGYGELSGNFWDRIKREAKGRNIELSLTIEEVWNQFEKQNGICALSGIKIKMPVSNNVNKRTASLDRIDSKKGYIKGNIQWVHKHINMMKRSYDQEYFINFCSLVSKHNKN